MKIIFSALLIAVPIMASAQLPAPATITPKAGSVVPPGEVVYSWVPVNGAWGYCLEARKLEKAGWATRWSICVPPSHSIAYPCTESGEWQWRIASAGPDGEKFSEWVPFTIGSPLSVQELPGLPESFSLSQNYPNPFNPTTTIRFELLSRTPVRLTVHDVLGREVATLVNETLESGVYETVWDATGMASGTYFYRLTSNGLVQTKRMVLLK